MMLPARKTDSPTTSSRARVLAGVCSIAFGLVAVGCAARSDTSAPDGHAPVGLGTGGDTAWSAPAAAESERGRDAGGTSDASTREFALTPTPHGAWSWSGRSLYENLIEYGFTADSTGFVLCTKDPTAAVFTKGCDLIDVATGRVTRHMTSEESYGSGEPHASDPAFAATFAELGFPAARGVSPMASEFVLRWDHEGGAAADQPFEHLSFRLERAATRESRALAQIDATESAAGLKVFPRDAVLSPDGRKLALVVDRVGAPPLLADVRIVDVQAAVLE